MALTGKIHRKFLIRKDRGYVYDIWLYKVLSIEKLFQSKIIWEEK